MLEIKTNQLKTRKHVLIDDHPYTVRRLGAGEELRLSQMLRTLNDLTKKEKEGQLEDDLIKDADRLSTEMLEITAACFDDGEGGKRSAKLISQLTSQELQEVYKQVFKEPDEPTTPATNQT